MKHTIKLLSLAFTLAAILTLTGCPGPVNPDKPCTHEHTKTEVIEEATYNKDGRGKIVCLDCEEVLDEQATISRFVAGGYDGDIPNEVLTENNTEDTYRYQYNGEDDYQIEVYVYSSVEDALDNRNEKVLYFSFPNDTTGIPQIITINDKLAITIDDLIQMKNGYIGKTVKYFNSNNRDGLLQWINEKWEYEEEYSSLAGLDKNSPIYIVIE